MRFSFVRRRVEVLTHIGISSLGISEVLRSRKLGHLKSRNSEIIIAVDLWEDTCHAIIHFKDLGTGIRGGKSPEIGIGILGLQ
jgi:hypothetical protein